MSGALDEVIEVSNHDDFAEIGGAHNQKGVDFQRCWAITKIIGLEEDGTSDFLFLFEAIQDIAVLDSSTAPTAVSIYQIKKRDRKEWTWSDLTSLHAPGSRRKKPTNAIQQSVLGKLYKGVRAFKTLKASGRFVSNAGCDLDLINGANAATSSVCALSTLSATHQSLLSAALKTLHAAGEDAPDLSLLLLERVPLPPDDPVTYATGVVHTFLKKRSPKHAGQARALVEALLGQIGPLGGRTDRCSTFAEMCQRKGYSRTEFSQALGDLEEVVDVASYLESWFAQMTREGASFLDITSIKAAVSSLYRRQVMGGTSQRELEIVHASDAWLALQSTPTNLKEFFEQAYGHLQPKFPSVRKAELLAHFALRAVTKCTAPTSENS